MRFNLAYIYRAKTHQKFNFFVGFPAKMLQKIREKHAKLFPFTIKNRFFFIYLTNSIEFYLKKFIYPNLDYVLIENID